MERHVLRVRRWWMQLMTKLKQRHWRTWATLIGVGFVVEEIALSLIPGITRTVLGWLWLGLSHLVALPLGYGGLALIFFVALLLGLSYWETRPRPVTKHADSEIGHPPLSASDKDAIARIRTLWFHQKGQDSTRILIRMVNETQESLKEKYYVAYHKSVCDSLVTTAEELEAVLDLEKGTPLEDAIRAFNEVFAGYLNNAQLLYHTHENRDVDLCDGKPLQLYRAFRTAHAEYAKELVQATEYPGIHQRLNVFANQQYEVAWGPLVSRMFLGERDWKGGPLSTITPSVSDTEVHPDPESEEADNAG